MTAVDIITLFITIICLVSFCAVFTILFRYYYRSNMDAVSSGKEDIALIDNAIDSEREKKSKVKKSLKMVGKIFSYVVLGVIFGVFVFALVSKVQDNTMPFGDSTIVVIASGSMSERNSDAVKNHPELTNQFDTYDIIGITKYKNPEQVQLYDVIAYKNKKDVTTVHRIVEIRQVDGVDVYITQGDSNKANDTGSQYDNYLTYDRIVGYYNGTRLKGVGIFVIFLQSPAGIVTVLSVIYCLLMFDHYSSKYTRCIEERTNLLVKLIDYDVEHPQEEDVQSRYHETLLYKDSLYTFEDGKYVGKENKDGFEKVFKNHMVFVKKEAGGNTVTVTNTKTKEETVYTGVSDEELMTPEKFIPKAELVDEEDEEESER